MYLPKDAEDLEREVEKNSGVARIPVHLILIYVLLVGVHVAGGFLPLLPAFLILLLLGPFLGISRLAIFRVHPPFGSLGHRFFA